MKKIYNNKRILWIAIIALFVLLYFVNQNINSFLNRLIFIANSNHTGTIEGFISSNSKATSVIYSLLLLIAQSVLIPIKEKYMVQAILSEFGTINGKIIIIMGFTLGACICFALSRLVFFLFKALFKTRYFVLEHNDKLQRMNTILLVILRLLPMNYQDFFSYAFGITNISIYKYILFSFIVFSIKVCFFSMFKAIKTYF